MKKFLCTILSLFLTLGVVFGMSGCEEENVYNAKLYTDNCKKWLTPEFLENNQLRGDWGVEYGEGVEETLPKERTIAVTEENFEEVFLPNTLEVDFSKQEVWVYLFVASYNYNLDYITLENNKMSVYYIMPYTNKKGWSAPGLICLVLTMDKTNGVSVEFIEQQQETGFLGMLYACANDCADE